MTVGTVQGSGCTADWHPFRTGGTHASMQSPKEHELPGEPELLSLQRRYAQGSVTFLGVGHCTGDKAVSH